VHILAIRAQFRGIPWKTQPQMHQKAREKMFGKKTKVDVGNEVYAKIGSEFTLNLLIISCSAKNYFGQIKRIL
jgi:hypothetical protein